MTTIDPTTDIGRIRLRISDFSDVPYLNDATIQATLNDNAGNLPRTAKTCAMFILGMLSQRTHRKINQLEVWGGDAAKAYTAFLMLSFTNPSFMDISPLPYAATEDYNRIIDFQQNWNKTYYQNTEAQALARLADFSPNSGSREGTFRGGF